MEACECELDPQFKATYYSDAAKIIKGQDAARYQKLVLEAINCYAVNGKMS